jgi:hypothetical protein
VTDAAGCNYEAHVFSPLLRTQGEDEAHDKLFRARKRKLKRLFRSMRFVCEVDEAGKRFVIVRSTAECTDASSASDRQTARHSAETATDSSSVLSHPSYSYGQLGRGETSNSCITSSKVCIALKFWLFRFLIERKDEFRFVAL